VGLQPRGCATPPSPSGEGGQVFRLPIHLTSMSFSSVVSTSHAPGGPPERYSVMTVATEPGWLIVFAVSESVVQQGFAQGPAGRATVPNDRRQPREPRVAPRRAQGLKFTDVVAPLSEGPTV